MSTNNVREEQQQHEQTKRPQQHAAWLPPTPNSPDDAGVHQLALPPASSFELPPPLAQSSSSSTGARATRAPVSGIGHASLVWTNFVDPQQQQQHNQHGQQPRQAQYDARLAPAKLGFFDESPAPPPHTVSSISLSSATAATLASASAPAMSATVGPALTALPSSSGASSAPVNGRPKLCVAEDKLPLPRMGDLVAATASTSSSSSSGTSAKRPATESDFSALPSNVQKRQRRAAAVQAAAAVELNAKDLRTASGIVDEAVDAAALDDDDDYDELDAGVDAGVCGGGAAPSNAGAGAGGAGRTGTRRRVSHSLIERRRREKINECLARLREGVPQCREHVSLKEKRAKDRARRRGESFGSGAAGVEDDGDDDDDDEYAGEGSKRKRKAAKKKARTDADAGGGAKGANLHKLEILQGTLLYIEELKKRIRELEANAACVAPSSAGSSVDSDEGASISTLEDLQGSLPPPSLPMRPPPPQPQQSAASRRGLSAEDTAAVLLLRFSTSPQLAPVR